MHEPVLEPAPAAAPVAEPALPARDDRFGPAQILALQRGAGNAAVSRALARKEAGPADPAVPPAHLMSEAVPKILGVAGGTVKLSVEGEQVTVAIADFARDWAPHGTNPAVAESNLWYRQCWEQIVSGSGIPIGFAAARADKGLSIELADAPAADTSAERVLAWLDKHKDLIAAAEDKHKIDRRAIAGAIAWEALENVRGSLAGAAGRFEGPGKVHIKDFRAVPAGVATGTTVAEEVEEAGILPKQTTSVRQKLLKTPAGSIEYVAGTMRLGVNIANEFGFDISGDPRALCFFFNAMDSAKWRAKLAKKKPGSEFVFHEAITEWMGSNLPYLEKAVGESALKATAPAAVTATPAPEPDPAELRTRIEQLTFTLAEAVVRADDRGAQSIEISVTRSGGQLVPAVQSTDEPRYARPANRTSMTMAGALAKLKAPMDMLMASPSVKISFSRVAEGWLELSLSTAVQGPRKAPADGATLARTPADAPATDAGIAKPEEKPAADPTITYGPQAVESAVTPEALAVLKDVLKAAGVTSAQISSTARDTTDQARAMYNNLEGTGKGQGVEAQRILYAATGDKVIDVYEALKKEKKSPDEIKQAMKEKIDELGPSTVSLHLADSSKLCVFDVGPKSVDEKLHGKLNEAAKAQVGKRIRNYIPYPDDPGFHFEIAVAAPEAKRTP